MSYMKLRKILGPCLVLSALIVASLLSGCQTTDVYRPPEVDGFASTPVATLRVGDTVRVIFSSLGTTQISPHEEQIKADGTITPPLVGAIVAEGKTTGELQNDLQKAYSKFYVAMNITVLAPDRFYSVGGEVRNPSRQIYIGGTTVIKAIQSAGDFTDFAKKTQVQLTRADGTSFTINCEKALRNPSLDLPVYPGDTIHVPRRIF